MGHLDPFLQDLNGIGIIAMMVGISAVIVRVVFCKTMRDRIYTGVGGLISAIVMSLGIDYAIRPFAGTGESTATNGLGFVQLMIGVVIALIGGAVLRGILSLDVDFLPAAKAGGFRPAHQGLGEVRRQASHGSSTRDSPRLVRLTSAGHRPCPIDDGHPG